MGHSSLAGGSLNRASSRSSAARTLQIFLWVAQWFFWQIALQYLTCMHDMHALRLTPPSLPHSAQQLDVIFLLTYSTLLFRIPRHDFISIDIKIKSVSVCVSVCVSVWGTKLSIHLISELNFCDQMSIIYVCLFTNPPKRIQTRQNYKPKPPTSRTHL